MKKSGNVQKVEARQAYVEPRLKRWGTVADITRIGNTISGDDNWPGAAAKNQEPGSNTGSNAGGRKW